LPLLEVALQSWEKEKYPVKAVNPTKGGKGAEQTDPVGDKAIPKGISLPAPVAKKVFCFSGKNTPSKLGKTLLFLCLFLCSYFNKITPIK